MLRLTLIGASSRQPKWVEEGYAEYAERLRGRVQLDLKVVALARRSAAMPATRAMTEEGERLLAAIPGGAHVVALAVDGKPWSTADLVLKLADWRDRALPVAFLVGGPDGLADACLARAVERWSLSPLTLPHGLVRVVVAEALYRAWSVIEGHPYHRA